MTVDGFFSMIEGVIKKADRTDSKERSIKADFDKEVGSNEKQHDEVVRLIESYEDSEDAIDQYNDTVKKCGDEINTLTANIAQLNTNLKKTKKPEDKEWIRAEIATKEAELNATINQQKNAKQGIDDETRKIGKITKNLSKRGVTDPQKAVKAAKKMDNALIENSKSNMASNILGKMGKMAGPIAAVGTLVKAIEFGIGKATDYVRLNTENMLRAIQANMQVSLNQMKAGLDSWSDAVSGAYSSQSLMIDSQLAMLEAQNATAMANLKMQHTWTDWIPIWGSINKYQEAATEQEQKAAEARLKTAQTEIQQLSEYVKKTDEYIKKQDKAVHGLQIDYGMSAGQTDKLEDRLFGLGEKLAKFNTTIDDALKFQTNFATSSGRNINFTNGEYEQNAAVGRLVGNDDLANFAAQANLFNTSVSDAADIMYDTYKDLSRMGLSQKKVIKDSLANMKMMQRYNFKGGTKEFMELAKWAENARFNLGSLGGAMDKVQEGGIEGVINQSAGLQVLSGPFAIGSDPLGMFYDSFDPDSYAKRIQSMFSQFGRFNEDTGTTTFSRPEQMLMQTAAKQLGISKEDAMNMARGARQKDVVKRQMGGSTLNADDQDAIANRAQFDQETGKWYVNTLSGRMNVADVKATDLDNILSGNKEEDAAKYAQSTLSIQEQIEATTKEIDAKLGDLTLDNFRAISKEQIDATLKAYSKNSGELKSFISTFRQDAINNQKKMLEGLSSLGATYSKDKAIVATNGKAYSKDRGADLRMKWKNERNTDAADELKKHPEYRVGMSISEMKELRKYDTRGISAIWDHHRDTNWVPGKEGDLATDYDPTRDISQERRYKAGHKPTIENNYWDAYSNLAFKDSVATSRPNTSMLVSAANVTPIQDGSVNFAKSDPKDTAIFAKTGGPFDTLFNDVFGKINALYDMSLGNNPMSPAKNTFKTVLPQSKDASISELARGQSATNANISAPTTNQPLEVCHKGEILLKSPNGETINIMNLIQQDPLLVRKLTEVIVTQINCNRNGGKTEPFINRFSSM